MLVNVNAILDTTTLIVITHARTQTHTHTDTHARMHAYTNINTHMNEPTLVLT